VKPNVWIGMLAGMLLGGLCVLALARPYEKTRAQESSSNLQSSAIMSQTTSDQDIELMRQDLRNKKRQIIAENLSLSDAEAEKFWPIYQHYTNDLKLVYDQKYVLLKNYAQSWGGHVQSGCPHLYSPLAGTRSTGPGTSFQVCARGQPGLNRKRHRHILPIGSSHQHDDGCTNQLANSTSARQKEVASFFNRPATASYSRVFFLYALPLAPIWPVSGTAPVALQTRV
jgi:hypothetical protein